MIKSRIIYLIIVLGLFLFYLFCNSYTPLAIIIMLISMTFFGIFSTLFSRDKIELSIKPNLEYAQQKRDCQAEFYIKIENRSFFPVSAIRFDVVFQDSAEDGTIKRSVKTSIASGEKKYIHIVAATSHAAYIEGKIQKARMYDTFGLICFKVKKVKDTAHLMISPKASKNSFINKQEDIFVLDSDKYSETQKGEDSSQVFEVRQYMPGDDIRRIHWRLSSKQDELIVKEYSKPINDDCVVILESGIYTDQCEEKKLRSDTILSIFVKLAAELLENEQSFSVYWYSQKANSLVSFYIEIFEDAAPVIKEFLSEKYSSSQNISLIMSNEEYDHFINHRIYYIYNSSCSLPNNLPANTDSLFIPIDSYSEIQYSKKFEK